MGLQAGESSTLQGGTPATQSLQHTGAGNPAGLGDAAWHARPDAQHGSRRWGGGSCSVHSAGHLLVTSCDCLPVPNTLLEHMGNQLLLGPWGHPCPGHSCKVSGWSGGAGCQSKPCPFGISLLGVGLLTLSPVGKPHRATSQAVQAGAAPQSAGTWCRGKAWQMHLPAACWAAPGAREMLLVTPTALEWGGRFPCYGLRIPKECGLAWPQDPAASQRGLLVLKSDTDSGPQPLLAALPLLGQPIAQGGDSFCIPVPFGHPDVSTLLFIDWLVGWFPNYGDNVRK